MLRVRHLWALVIPLALLLAIGPSYRSHLASAASQAGSADDQKGLIERVDQLQKQVAELQAQMTDLSKHRIVAAGTATWTRPETQANRTAARVKLPAEIAERLGKDYIVLLTNRLPAGGYPYFNDYWKPASDGFDVTLVDPELGDGSTASYANPTKTYLIDWIVVRK